MGGDHWRVYWILKNYNNDTVNPLADSSILKEWELVQVCATFLLAGGIVTQYFTSVRCQKDNDSACKYQESCRFLSGVIIVSLLAVLFLTVMCRVYVLGEYSWLQNSLYDAQKKMKILETEAGKEFAKKYWQWEYDKGRRVGKTLYRFAGIIGQISVATKVVLLVIIVLWMVVISMASYPKRGIPGYTAPLTAPPPIWGFIALVVIECLVFFLMCCIFWLLRKVGSMRPAAEMDPV
jgi:hypothetical protein